MRLASLLCLLLAGCSGADQGADHRPLWQQHRLGEVWALLSEMAHLRYQTAGHEEFDRLHGEWAAAIARAGAFPGRSRAETG